MNKCFKDFPNSSTPLYKFVTQYEKALDSLYNKERDKTFKTLNSKPFWELCIHWRRSFKKLYKKIFRKFQDELIGYQKFSVKKIIFVVEVITYKVYEIYNEKTTYNVTYHVNSKEATCNCHLFEFLDILCRHVLAVLIKNAHSLPSQYILRWWTINAKEKVKTLTDEEFGKATMKLLALHYFTMLWLDVLNYLKKVHGQKSIMMLQFKPCERQLC